MISFPGPCSALVVLPTTSDEEGIGRALQLEQLLHEALPCILETVPAFNRLLIEGVPELWDAVEVEGEVRRQIASAFTAPPPALSGASITLPACYDPAIAPDLAQIAHSAGLTAQQVASIHADGIYTVLATGFAPGFAYLGSVDERIARPRRAEPRPLVPAGALGIADRRTGVYPSSGPGGWQLIGRVPASLFADVTERIARFEPGMKVQFRPISRQDFDAESDE